MSGGRLSVDLDALGQVATQLDGLKSEFEQSTRLADVDDTVGSDAVRDALHEFGNNWKWHKLKLVEKIDSVKTMASESKLTYEKADLDLASALRGSGPA